MHDRSHQTIDRTAVSGSILTAGTSFAKCTTGIWGVAKGPGVQPSRRLCCFPMSKGSREKCGFLFFIQGARLFKTRKRMAAKESISLLAKSVSPMLYRHPETRTLAKTGRSEAPAPGAHLALRSEATAGVPGSVRCPQGTRQGIPWPNS